jgi:hypothetical protein
MFEFGSTAFVPSRDHAVVERVRRAATLYDRTWCTCQERQLVW